MLTNFVAKFMKLVDPTLIIGTLAFRNRLEDSNFDLDD